MTTIKLTKKESTQPSQSRSLQSSVQAGIAAAEEERGGGHHDEEEEMSRTRMRVGTIFVFRSVHPGQGATENYAQATAWKPLYMFAQAHVTIFA